MACLLSGTVQSAEFFDSSDQVFAVFGSFKYFSALMPDYVLFK
jgi:hypothetical protein